MRADGPRLALPVLFVGSLIYAVEVWPQFGGRSLNKSPVDVCEWHLRFQRTLPSLLSSIIIPRSANSVRIWALLAKARRCLAACRSAQFGSTHECDASACPGASRNSFDFPPALAWTA